MLGSGVWVLLLFVVSGSYAFVTGSDVVKAGLTLGAQLRIISNFGSSCFYLLCAGLTGVPHYSWLVQCWGPNPGYQGMLGKHSTN